MRQTRRLAAILERLARAGGSEMLREDLLKPDLVSEIVLLGCGALLVVSLLLIVNALT